MRPTQGQDILTVKARTYSQIVRISGTWQTPGPSIWVRPDPSVSAWFTTLATLLKNDVILVEPSLSPTSDPPFILSPAITAFLSAGCLISPAEVSGAWALLKNVIWSGGITINVGLLWETHGTRRGVCPAEYLLYPPSHSCLHPNCQRRTKGMSLKKAAQTYVVLFTLTKGPCVAKSVHIRKSTWN
ncbi:hypothetical protein DFJ58DRAFT_846804 [Suillus subalutaceus]|uniref:uncharacterized protein n=1 Tax=Suillus subalutaceus TaxID=48586 RepID=UPI001B87AEBB|nr:uncharacterized protein DFJ58DRAFT_846804 [Suillus subalutaceus]KAG1836767.1 hypothetical protein DFJ58DRAFT_846804 [Suillus subalutaceus]